jgi:hypothetical protein
MANTQAMCSSFKQELLQGIHAFGTTVTRGGTGADTFKLALFLATATLSAATTAYSTTGELAATGNYSAGGVTLTNGTAPSLSSTTAIWTPSGERPMDQLSPRPARSTARCSTTRRRSNKAVAVFTFSAQSVTAGTFTLTMPTNDASNALIRVA